MPKLALFLSAFFLLILFQQSSYGFIEGAEVPILTNFDIERTSDIISIDLSHQENPAKRYLVYGSGSLTAHLLIQKILHTELTQTRDFFRLGF